MAYSSSVKKSMIILLLKVVSLNVNFLWCRNDYCYYEPNCCLLTYLFRFKMGFSSPKQPPKNLDLSYKTDLDFLGWFKKSKPHLISELNKTYLHIIFYLHTWDKFGRKILHL